MYIYIYIYREIYLSNSEGKNRNFLLQEVETDIFSKEISVPILKILK